jgi:hypothetical protein
MIYDWLGRTASSAFVGVGFNTVGVIRIIYSTG